MASRGKPTQVPWLAPARDAMTALLAGAAFVNEVFLAEVPRDVIVWAALGMLGVPLALSTDRFLRRTSLAGDEGDPAAEPAGDSPGPGAP